MRREQKRKFGMRLKRVLYQSGLVLTAVAFLGVGIFAWKNYDYFFYNAKKNFAPQLVSFSLDHIYSHTLGNELVAFIEQKTAPEKLPDFSPSQFAAEFKKKFPVIKHLEICRLTPEQLHITIVGRKPCLRFSDGRILANRSLLFKQEFFEDYGLEKLPMVELAQTFTALSVPKNLYAFFSRIPLDHWKKYHLKYDSFEKMYLQPRRHDLKYGCIVDQEVLFDNKKLAQVEKLYEQLSLSMQSTKKRNTMFMFDLRFADRIFISQQKGGGGNEYHHAV